MLKIPQARLPQYVNRELPDAQAGLRKGRGTRDQVFPVVMYGYESTMLSLTTERVIIAVALRSFWKSAHKHFSK